MEIHSSPETDSIDSLGNTISRSDAKSHALASFRLVFLHYSQSRYSYILHDCIANSFLVRVHKSGARVGF